MEQIISKAFALSGCQFIDQVRPGQKPPVGKKHRNLGSDVILFGYANEKGCFSVRDLKDGSLDIAFYPGYRAKDVDDVAINNAIYHQLPNVPGWGYAAWSEMIQIELKEMRSDPDYHMVIWD